MQRVQKHNDLVTVLRPLGSATLQSSGFSIFPAFQNHINPHEKGQLGLESYRTLVRSGIFFDTIDTKKTSNVHIFASG